MAPETDAPQAAAPDFARERDQHEQAETRREAVAAATVAGEAKRGQIGLAPEAAQAALDWFLGDETMPLDKTIKVNIGSPDQPRDIAWTITAIDGETLKRARKGAEEGNRASKRRQRQGGEAPEIDPQEANARIVVAGTIAPNFRELAATKMRAANVLDQHPDPDVPAVMLLKGRLAHKPGLIDQIAGEILALSGYDDDDISEFPAGKV